MANFGNLLKKEFKRGIVEDRRGNPLPVQYTRPIVNHSVPNLGTPNRYGGHYMPTPGEELDALVYDSELSRSQQFGKKPKGR